MSKNRIRTRSVRSQVGARVEVAGWLQAVRRMGEIAFLVVRDGEGLVQVVAPRSATAELDQAGAGLESVVRVRGRVVENPRAPGGAELVEPDIEVLVAVSEPLPVPLGAALASAKLPALLDHAPVVLRDPTRRAVLELAAGVTEGFRGTLRAEGFREIHTPRIVGAATESGANVFSLAYFGQTAYLAQSPQLYKQIMVGVFERVFEVGPVFRAEPHATVRHLSEYTSCDVELGFIEDHFDVVEVVRTVLAGILAGLREHHAEALARLAVTVPEVPPRLPWIGFAEARALLHEAGQGPLDEPDLAPAEERWLGEWAQREHASDFLVVSGYPASKRPFYTHPDPERPGSTRSFDVLFRGTELVTGGQRRHLHHDLVTAMQAAGLPLEPFTGYLEAFRFGLPPHGGFAIGLERLVAQLCGLSNIRLARAFPRDAQRTTP